MESKVFTKSESFKSEYSCCVARIGELTPVEGSDFLAKTLVQGTQIVVRKDQVKEGDIVIYASNETVLNQKFLSVNNLFEIGCRDMNANAKEVCEIMAEYEPIKEEADKKRSKAKNIKTTMESLTKQSQKIQKEIKKKQEKAEKVKDNQEEYAILTHDIPELQKKSDECIADAMALTTKYTNLKKEIEELVKSGEPIITEAKKHCGFFNKYGRVRCIILKGCPSFGFIFPPEDLIKFDPNVTMEDVLAYEGEEFDTVNGELFAKVYVPPVKENKTGNNSKTKSAQKKVKKFNRMIDGEFFFHYDTDQFQKFVQMFEPTDVVDISVKRHGTSIIIANVQVKEPIVLPFKNRMLNKFIDKTGLFKSKKIKDWKEIYGPVYSSRKVIKNKFINEDVGPGFYSTDIYTEWGDIIYPYLQKGMTVYGEVCGYETGSASPIQKTYDYGCEIGENNLMIYRITTTCEDGTKKEWEVTDILNWTKALVEWMKANGDENWKRMHPIDLLYHGTLGDLYPELDVTTHWHENLLTAMENDKEHFGMEENEPMCTHFESPREGVCIRRVGDVRPSCYKLKTVAFRFGEAIRMDNGEVDSEMEEGYTDSDES